LNTLNFSGSPFFHLSHTWPCVLFLSSAPHCLGEKENAMSSGSGHPGLVRTLRGLEEVMAEPLYLWSLLMLFNVTMNTELWVNAEPLLLGKYRIRHLWDCVHNILVSNQYITLLSACFHWETPYLIYSLDSLALNPWPAAL
jgi:hypothetical protein